ncbi:extracellular solute-binding protein [Tsukamurella sp. 8F]|uniref:extracellular solute-binding protein n=1 Tax=unclassified Tsukamurella TaxID=2633480 RepID=UPI0023B9D5A4|nr:MULTISPECIES: extracellular solute-binding protein [unclassified Tsukamurella]MDF0530355.1 extracellular solute-binding protein [Tsukamurella sp. 8J]MDF0587652.1 extracellular solute-binding protein [Tsukamurella sp. 8F]
MSVRDRVPGRGGVRRSWRTRSGAAALAAVMGATLVACGSGGGRPTLSVYAPADGASTIADVAPKCTTPQYDLRVYALPKDADGQRLQLARRVTGNDKTLDIMGMDVTWTAEFAEAGWARQAPDDVAAHIKDKVLPGPLKTAMWQDKLYAVPAWTNTQLLWYRKDSLEKVLGKKITKPPQLTWDQILDYAQKSRAIGGPAQIESQAAQYEGLVVWFNTLLESAGGKMVADDGKTVTLTDTPEHRAATVKALTIMKQVATAPGHDPSFTQLKENDGRLAMEAGKALFQVNWPFVFAGIRENAAGGAVPFLPELKKYAASVKEPSDAQLREMNALIQKKFDFAPYPSVQAGKPAKNTIGGVNFAVSSTSRYPDFAFAAIDCLTNTAAEKQYALSGGTPPVLPSLYDDPDFVKAYPMAGIIKAQLQDDTAAVRSPTPLYQAMSTLLQAKLSPVGSWDPSALANTLSDAAEKALSQKGLIP